MLKTLLLLLALCANVATYGATAAQLQRQAQELNQKAQNCYGEFCFQWQGYELAESLKWDKAKQHKVAMKWWDKCVAYKKKYYKIASRYLLALERERKEKETDSK